MFFVHHLLGVRPSRDEFVLRPRLLRGLNSVKTSLLLRGQTVEVHIAKADKEASAVVNGKRVPLVNGELRLLLPQRAVKIEMKV
jgi:cellobiose phosphorylase